MQLQLFELYKVSRNSASGHADPTSDPDDEQVMPQPEQPVQDMGQLEAFAQPPLVDDEYSMPFDNFDGQIWDTSAFDSQTLWGWDSGYGSLSADPMQDKQPSYGCGNIVKGKGGYEM